MGQIIRHPVAGDVPAMSVEEGIAWLERWARGRLGLDEEEFSRALDDACPRRPQLPAGVIRGIEAGFTIPRADVLLYSLSLAGVDVISLLLSAASA